MKLMERTAVDPMAAVRLATATGETVTVPNFDGFDLTITATPHAETVYEQWHREGKIKRRAEKPTMPLTSFRKIDGIDGAAILAEMAEG